MKKFILSNLIASIFLFASIHLSAQEPPHPPSGGHGLEGNSPAQNTAPIGEGVGTLMVLSVLYSALMIDKKRRFKQTGS